MYSIGQFLCVIQTNRWAFAVCASLGPGFLVRKRGKKSTSEASRARDFSSSSSQRGRRLKGKGKGVLGARETRGARPSRFPRAQNPLSLPFQTLATQSTLLQESGIDNVESGIQAGLSGTLTWSEVTILV